MILEAIRAVMSTDELDRHASGRAHDPLDLQKEPRTMGISAPRATIVPRPRCRVTILSPASSLSARLTVIRDTLKARASE